MGMVAMSSCVVVQSFVGSTQTFAMEGVNNKVTTYSYNPLYDPNYLKPVIVDNNKVVMFSWSFLYNPDYLKNVILSDGKSGLYKLFFDFEKNRGDSEHLAKLVSYLKEYLKRGGINDEDFLKKCKYVVKQIFDQIFYDDLKSEKVETELTLQDLEHAIEIEKEKLKIKSSANNESIIAEMVKQGLITEDHLNKIVNKNNLTDLYCRLSGTDASNLVNYLNEDFPHGVGTVRDVLTKGYLVKDMADNKMLNFLLKAGFNSKISQKCKFDSFKYFLTNLYEIYGYTIKKN